MRRIVIALLLGSLVLGGSTFSQGPQHENRLTILHWNDFHAQNTPWVVRPQGGAPAETVGGAATLFGMVRDIRAGRSDVAVFDAGDCFQGSPISSMTSGKSQVEILNHVSPTAVTLGNHEFDYGADSLKAAFATSDDMPADQRQDLLRCGRGDKDAAARQAEVVAEHLKKQDIAICTALIPGRKAPVLIGEAGVGLRMAPNALSVLDALGVGEAAKRHALLIERMLLMQTIDAKWKDHLYAMDQLRLDPAAKPRKSAAVVGDVLGNGHLGAQRVGGPGPVDQRDS